MVELNTKNFTQFKLLLLQQQLNIPGMMMNHSAYITILVYMLRLDSQPPARFEPDRPVLKWAGIARFATMGILHVHYTLPYPAEVLDVANTALNESYAQLLTTASYMQQF